MHALPISLLCLLWEGGYDTFINQIMCNVDLFLIGPDTMHWEQFCFIGWRLGLMFFFSPLFSKRKKNVLSMVRFKPDLSLFSTLYQQIQRISEGF